MWAGRPGQAGQGRLAGLAGPASPARTAQSGRFSWPDQAGRAGHAGWTGLAGRRGPDRLGQPGPPACPGSKPEASNNNWLRKKKLYYVQNWIFDSVTEPGVLVNIPSPPPIVSTFLNGRGARLESKNGRGARLESRGNTFRKTTRKLSRLAPLPSCRLSMGGGLG